MSRREKIFAAVVGLFVAVLLVYMIVNGLVLSNARKLDKQIAELTGSIEQKKNERQVYRVRAEQLKSFTDKTFGSDVDYASQQVRDRLSKVLDTCRLGVSLSPLQSTVLGHYKEAGWFVSARGNSNQVTDLLYLLNAEPYLNRVENLSLSPRPRSAEVEVQLRYTTLVPAVQGDGQLPAGPACTSDVPHSLDGSDRRQYDVIVSRDLFRPYVRKQLPPPPPVASPPQQPGLPPAPPPPPPARWRVISLTTWAGQQEVHVKDLDGGQVRSFKLGEQLGDAKIVMIDYRIMPIPNKSGVFSESRVILEIAREYWAVDLGKELAEKRKLASDELPGELLEAKGNQP